MWLASRSYIRRVLADVAAGAVRRPPVRQAAHAVLARLERAVAVKRLGRLRPVDLHLPCAAGVDLAVEEERVAPRDEAAGERRRAPTWC